MGEFSNPEDYELWMGRWSARLAPAFVNFADLRKRGRFLDVGSGTGVLAAALLAGVQDATVLGIEPSESYVAYCRARMRDQRVDFERGDALNMPFADGQFDGTLSLLILQELTDVPEAVNEMRRVTRAGGIVASSQWNFADGMPMLALFWDAVIETIGTNDARKNASNCMVVDYPDEKALRRLWEEAGLVEVETQLLEIEMVFKSFDDYWVPFSSGVTPTSRYAQKLSEGDRNALEDCLRQKAVGQPADDRFTLTAQAWAVRGSVPAKL
jgi:ubiquinone/menaquinone biosynthesis C-methylase UbiE